VNSLPFGFASFLRQGLPHLRSCHAGIPCSSSSYFVRDALKGGRGKQRPYNDRAQVAGAGSTPRLRSKKDDFYAVSARDDWPRSKRRGEKDASSNSANPASPRTIQSRTSLAVTGVRRIPLR
jgi:hypothetical protein